MNGRGTRERGLVVGGLKERPAFGPRKVGGGVPAGRATYIQTMQTFFLLFPLLAG